MIVITDETIHDPIIDRRDTMYPSIGALVDGRVYYTEDKYSTYYGYCFVDVEITINKKMFTLEKGNFFSIPSHEHEVEFKAINSKVFVVGRLGYKGQFVVGKVEEIGRLSYIDGCSDSMLVYPPRYGDPSISHLHFPKGINQSYHTHPSIRIGVVIKGSGFASMDGYELPLTAGCMFCLDEQELHRFRTEDEGMDIIAFHPDGEWGPTDENHTMLNRTYLKK